ncbi:MAG TPA: hypothetical protein V6C97_01095 [Oculatellaceae cyanobacterium]
MGRRVFCGHDRCGVLRAGPQIHQTDGRKHQRVPQGHEPDPGALGRHTHTGQVSVCVCLSTRMCVSINPCMCVSINVCVCVCVY